MSEEETGPEQNSAEAEQNENAGGDEGDANQGGDESAATAGETSGAEVIENSVETPSVLVPDVPQDDGAEKPVETEGEGGDKPVETEAEGGDSTEDPTAAAEGAEDATQAEASTENISKEPVGEEAEEQSAEEPKAEESESAVKSAEDPENVADAPDNTETQPGEGETSESKEVVDSGGATAEATQEEGKEGEGAAPEAATGATDSHVTATDTTEVKAPTEPESQGVTDNTSVGAEVSQPIDSASFSRANVSVKLVLATNETTTTAFAPDKPLKELRQFLSKAMEIPAEFLELQYSGQILDDEITLTNLGATPAGTIELNLYSTNQSYPTKPLQSKSDYVMPDVINVTVKDIENQIRTINVEIERFGGHKPYLGGFRHKESGVEFVNASSQTNTKLRPWDGKTRFCRDAQTVEEKREHQQTNYNTSTQMTGIDVYVSNGTDKLMTPGRYETADEFLGKRQDATVVIQSFFRRWAAKNFVEGLRDDRDNRLEWERAEDLRKQKEKEDRIKKEFDRRMNPKSKEDFDLLFHALEKWRLEETAEINKNLKGAQRKAALSMLLEQETQLIAAINRHKNDADKVNKEKSIKYFLDKASAPKKWRGPDGKMTEMDTPYTLRALQLKDIYNSINMKYLTQDERLDILLTLKHTVKEHDCKLSQEIVELIDREADLLMRGVKEENLEGLRKRISTLFLQYCKTPAFNPEAARLIKIPQDPSTLRKGVYYCSSCGLYLPSTEFPLSSNSASPGKCRSCRKIDNDARTRQDYSHYVYMLRQLRLSEEKMADGSRIALLLQEQDLQYLVENIWGGQSALSQWDDLYDLILVRWNKYFEWSPWNCILLTKDEAAAHDKVENLDQAYRDVFLNKIRQKHSLARNYFSRLAGMAEKVRDIEPTRSKRVLPDDQAIARKELTQLFTAAES